jgi:hypothetical protein
MDGEVRNMMDGWGILHLFIVWADWERTGEVSVLYGKQYIYSHYA